MKTYRRGAVVTTFHQ